MGRFTFPSMLNVPHESVQRIKGIMLGLQWLSCLEEGVGQSKHSSLRQRSELRTPPGSECLEGIAEGGRSRVRSEKENDDDHEDVCKGVCVDG